MENIVRNTIKKIYKSGFYTVTHVSHNTLSFSNCNGRVFSIQPKGHLYLFRSGYVTQWTEMGLTYESGYTTMGEIEKAHFSPDFQQTTDNPDFILRVVNQLTLN